MDKVPQITYPLVNREFLFYLGNLVGQTIKIDFHTITGNRGRFARVAMSLDISKPLLDRFELNGKWYKIEYEGLQSICFNCGCVGHVQTACPLLHKAVSGTGTEVDHRDAGTSEPPALPAPETGERFGPWLQVTRPKRNPRKFPEVSGQGDIAGNKSVVNQRIQGGDRDKAVGGSRFDILAENEGMAEDLVETIQETTENHDGEASREGRHQKGNKHSARSSNLVLSAGVKSKDGAQGGNSCGPKQSSKSKNSKGGGASTSVIRPNTVGPLVHSNEFDGIELNAGRTKDNKIRKIKEHSEVGPIHADKQTTELRDITNRFHPGRQRGSGGVEDPIFRKPPKTRSALTLGKRKTNNDEITIPPSATPQFNPVVHVEEGQERMEDDGGRMVTDEVEEDETGTMVRDCTESRMTES